MKGIVSHLELNHSLFGEEEEKKTREEKKGRGFEDVQEFNLAEFLPKASFQEKGLWSVFNLNLHVLC